MWWPGCRLSLSCSEIQALVRRDLAETEDRTCRAARGWPNSVGDKATNAKIVTCRRSLRVRVQQRAKRGFTGMREPDHESVTVQFVSDRLGATLVKTPSPALRLCYAALCFSEMCSPTDNMRIASSAARRRRRSPSRMASSNVHGRFRIEAKAEIP